MSNAICYLSDGKKIWKKKHCYKQPLDLEVFERDICLRHTNAITNRQIIDTNDNKDNRILKDPLDIQVVLLLSNGFLVSSLAANSDDNDFLAEKILVIKLEI